VSKARLVITAVVLEGRSQAEVARDYQVSKGWVSKLIARYRAEGDAAFEPRSRRPHDSPNKTPDGTVRLIVAIRDRLVGGGHDAGADKIIWHLAHDHQLLVSRPTVNRVLRRQGRITPQPNKRPRSSYIRFQAELPNEMWQADFTHWRLADGSEVEILCWIDDHSRYALSVTAHRRVTGPIVVDTFTKALEAHGVPASTLTDNGMVFTTRLSGGKGGRNGYESLLDTLGVTQKNSRPNHPTTCGKVERFHQTLKRWLTAHPPAATIDELQVLLDQFVAEYNHQRPHSSLGDRTPITAYLARPKATATTDHHTHYRVRHDRVSHGNVTLRVGGVLHHIGLGRHLHGTRIIMLVDDLDVRVIHATTGELLRTLTIDPTRRYHGTGAPIGGPRRPYGPRKTRPAEPTTQVRRFPMS
jgi:transposase InsO family protein